MAIKTTVLVLLLGLTALAPAEAAEERLVKVAGLGSMDGADKDFGTNARIALQVAAQEVNSGGGVKLRDGTTGRIRLTYFNQDANAAVDIVRRLASEDWLVVIGPTCSKIAEPVFNALQRRVADADDVGLRFPILNDAAMKGRLGRVSEWGFRNTPDEAAMYERLLKWIKGQYPGVRTIGGGAEADFFHSRDVWGEVKRLAKPLGYEIVADESWTTSDTDLSKPVTAWRRAKPDLVVVPAGRFSGCAVLREMKRQEVKPRVIVGLTSAATPATLRDCGVEVEGMIVPTTFHPGASGATRPAQSSGQLSFNLYAAAAYENLYLIKQAIEASAVEAKPTTVEADRRRLRDALARIKEFRGLLGTVKRTDERESIKPYVFVQAKGSEWVVVHDSR